MKAHINGITVEGTPQEIAEYQRIHATKKIIDKDGLDKALEELKRVLMKYRDADQTYKNWLLQKTPTTSTDVDWMNYQTRITGGTTNVSAPSGWDGIWRN